MNIKKNSIFISLSFLIIIVACRQNPFVQGERLYKVYCINCHMANGEGFRLLYPPLAGSDYLKEHFEDLPCIIRHGMTDTLIVNGQMYNLPMPPIKELNEVEITNIINYINYKWDFQRDQVKVIDVIEKLESCN